MRDSASVAGAVSSQLAGIVGPVTLRDSIDEETECVYAAGDPVMLRRAGCHQKRLAPYEHGWIVVYRISASTINIRHLDTEAEKTMNVQLLRPDVLAEEPYLEF